MGFTITGTMGVFECDHPGCRKRALTKPITVTPQITVLKAVGWEVPNLHDAYCPDHAKEHQ